MKEKERNRSFWNLITWPWHSFTAPCQTHILTFCPPYPHPTLFSWIFPFFPLCPNVISLMMCNALKVLHQPDLLKWSMGNALGHFSSHPSPLSLSLRLCFSPSLLTLSLRSILQLIRCPEHGSFPSAFFSCLALLSPPSFSLSLRSCFRLFLSLLLRGVWTRPLNQQHRRKWTRGIWPLPLSPQSA